MTEIRLTTARKSILEVLDHQNQHLTPAQIHHELKVRLPSINLSTVYRALDYLVDHNLITVADIGVGSPVYERLGKSPHHHLICLNCEKILEMDHEIVAPFFKNLQQKMGFVIETNHLVLYGTCSNCKE